ncbi:benzoate/H(+) symporter BenE family transporter [Enterobacter hormaechei]
MRRLRHHAGIGLSAGGLTADRCHRRAGAAVVPFGVYSICIAAIAAAICQSPDAHPDASKRWLAAAAAGGFICWRGCSAGRFGADVRLPLSGIQTLAGLALLGTISGSFSRH